MSASIKVVQDVKLAKAAQKANLVAILWTLPALLFYGLFAIIPMFIALYLSFSK